MRTFALEWNKIINKEVDRLLDAGHIQKVLYPTWLANTVLVPKKEGMWRVCIDYIDLIKACPKDSFPIPRIDELADGIAGNELLSFLDAYSRYNQIKIHPSDQEKTSFITKRGLFCYEVMPFGLKNIGATYQRLVNTMFHKQIRESMEIYIDDMLVKSKHAENNISHLTKAFDTLQ